MAIQLKKGENLSLKKAAPGMTKILVGLGWDVRATDGAAFDLDASAFMVNAAEKCSKDGDFVFYGMAKINNKLITADGSVEHTGDNRTGAGDGDDESLKVDLSKVPADIQKIVFTVTIYEAEERRQSFGQVKNAFIRLVNDETDTEVARFDLSEDASTETAMMFAELYRKDGEWKFRAIGQGFAGGLGALATHFGLSIG